MKKSIVVLLHVGYWMVYLFLLFVMLLFLQQGKDGHIVPPIFFRKIFLIFTLVPGIIGFYASYQYLFPKFLQKKKLAALLLYCIPTSFVAALAGSLALSLLVKWDLMFNDGFTSASAEFMVMALIAFCHVILALVMRGFVNWYSDIKLKEELSKRNNEMELALIKSQINPHFLFNTINNIDTMIAKDATKASDYLNKLSDILRFSLYETKTEKIALSREIMYIEKFIALQKIRTTNQNYVDFKVTGDTEALMIPPMIFIPFIENAFKHTEDNKTAGAIRINLIADKDKIVFYCENNSPSSKKITSDFGGLGSDLIRKRLNLLYPNRHNLELKEIDELYKVTLTLFLHGN